MDASYTEIYNSDTEMDAMLIYCLGNVITTLKDGSSGLYLPTEHFRSEVARRHGS
jgi:hypothetical protein